MNPTKENPLITPDMNREENRTYLAVLLRKFQQETNFKNQQMANVFKVPSKFICAYLDGETIPENPEMAQTLYRNLARNVLYYERVGKIKKQNWSEYETFREVREYFGSPLEPTEGKGLPVDTQQRFPCYFNDDPKKILEILEFRTKLERLFLVRLIQQYVVLGKHTEKSKKDRVAKKLDINAGTFKNYLRAENPQLMGTDKSAQIANTLKKLIAAGLESHKLQEEDWPDFVPMDLEKQEILVREVLIRKEQRGKKLLAFLKERGVEHPIRVLDFVANPTKITLVNPQIKKLLFGWLTEGTFDEWVNAQDNNSQSKSTPNNQAIDLQTDETRAAEDYSMGESLANPETETEVTPIPSIPLSSEDVVKILEHTLTEAMRQLQTEVNRRFSVIHDELSEVRKMMSAPNANTDHPAEMILEMERKLNGLTKDIETLFRILEHIKSHGPKTYPGNALLREMLEKMTTAHEYLEMATSIIGKEINRSENP